MHFAMPRSTNALVTTIKQLKAASEWRARATAGRTLQHNWH